MTHLARSYLLVSLTLTALLPLAAAATPDPTPDSNAAVVRLRVSCGSSPDNENCFESMSALTATGTTGWIWATRNPTASAPLLVDIGPGTFGKFICNGTGTARGFVTLRGSGRDQTTLFDSNRAVDITDCKSLSFIDIGVHGGRYGATWAGAEGGSSSWSNVDMFASLEQQAGLVSAWADDVCNGQTSRSIHYFHGSRFRVVGVQKSNSLPVAFLSRCSENWIFGSEVFVDITGGPNTFTGVPGVTIVEGGFVEAFGTAIRGRLTGSADQAELLGVRVGGSPGSAHSLPVAFHSHGANIGLATNAATETDIAVVAVSAQDNVMVHMPGTAYALSPGTSASATRVRITGGTPHMMAPFHWSADTAPPAVTTVKGEDLFVETDCANTGCSSTGTEPHLLVSNPGCTSGWWDVGLKACR